MHRDRSMVCGDNIAYVRKHYGIEIDPAKLQFGGIIGRAEIVDCVKRSDSPWFTGKFGFVLRRARKLPFIVNKGMLGHCDAPFNLPPIYLKASNRCVNMKADSGKSSLRAPPKARDRLRAAR